MSLSVDEIDKPRSDFRRANGAPMYVDSEGKSRRGSRPSGWGKELDDENALVNWKINRSIEGVAKNPDLAAAAVALKEDDRDGWATIREKAINAGRGAQKADIGTAIHAMSVRWEDPDDDFDPGKPYTEHLEAYSAELNRLGLVSDRFEFPIVNERLNSAGTADRLYRTTRVLITPTGEVLPIGTLLIGDLKTGKKLDFSMPSYAVQTAIYAEGQWYNVETDQFIETPPINQDWGLLVHLPSDRPECSILWVDLEVGRRGADLVAAVREWRRAWRSGDFTMPMVPDPTMEVSEIASALEATVMTVDEADAEWLELMTPWAQERINQVRGHNGARTYLMTRWPEGVPTPKQGIAVIDDMKRVLDLLDKTEAEFGLQFVPRPGVETGHKSGITRSNTPHKENI